jgi:putative membrane protein
MTAPLVAGLHYLALAFGLGGVYGRWRGLSAASAGTGSVRAGEKERWVGAILHGDNWYGVAALLWAATGLFRAFGGIEKGSDYYLANKLFLAKMWVFALVFALEIWPMVSFIQWRLQMKRGKFVLPARGRLVWLARLTAAEGILLLVMPFLAALMARGFGA